MAERSDRARGSMGAHATPAADAVAALQRRLESVLARRELPEQSLSLSAVDGDEVGLLLDLRRSMGQPVTLLPDAADMRSGSDRLLAAILRDALVAQARQIHLEPRRDALLVRYRLQGGLADQLVLKGQLSTGMREHLTAMVGNGAVARLDLTGPDGEPDTMIFPVEHLKTHQGGRFVISRPITGPRGVQFAALGIGPVGRRAIHHALNERSGLILVAGAANSGRRATMRAMLNAQVEMGRSVIAAASIEAGVDDGVIEVDMRPVERPSEHVRALRSLLRQDPDVLALDLMDDRAAAQLAVDAAMEGRLVIARIEAPDAVSAISRLKAMRIDSFSIASALRLVVAQRLADRLCPACRHPVQASASTSALLGFDPGAIVYAAEGCPACDETGIAGRVGVFEVIDADQTIRRLVNSGGDAAILARHAFVNAPNMGSAARAMVREGTISANAAVRLSRSESMIG